MATASPPLVRDISDTARWAAVFRARESQRPDALFCDRFAGRLAGCRGVKLAETLSNETHNSAWTARTYLFDGIICSEIQGGVDMVVNLGAGLDVRPYRMKLPSSLRWIEVDLPEILAYKERILADEKPSCALDRISLNLLDRDRRLELFSEINRSGRRILIVSEGLLIYLHPDEVVALASELAGMDHIRRWILEMASPAVLDSMTRTLGCYLEEAGGSFQFGPAEGPTFFSRYGWDLVSAQSVPKTAIRLGRTGFDPKMHHLLPDLPPAGNVQPWVGVCLFDSQQPVSRV
jgi:methyltransferase (TIGR00027 family)